MCIFYNYIPPNSICFLIQGIISSNATSNDVLHSIFKFFFDFETSGTLL